MSTHPAHVTVEAAKGSIVIADSGHFDGLAQALVNEDARNLVAAADCDGTAFLVLVGFLAIEDGWFQYVAIPASDPDGPAALAAMVDIALDEVVAPGADIFVGLGEETEAFYRVTAVLDERATKRGPIVLSVPASDAEDGRTLQ